jgi:2-C-methyl-D-erythritol 4-phosphate cytidylyltransferase
MAGRPGFWVAIPAAGVGARVGAGTPKQYLLIRERPVLEHVLERFRALPAVSGIVVALAPGDTWWDTLDPAVRGGVTTVTGGRERCHSVLNCLDHLRGAAAADDWVMVHDAARPCVRSADLERLMDLGGRHPVGAILALPISDTVKRGSAGGEIVETVDRHNLWRALTPQMFRVERLARALAQATDGGRQVTDEAQAMELSGLQPLLVEGRSDNIKITRGEDLALAEWLLARQEAET